ncbi:hypothetical protein [Streptomyces collinus]|uniref:hypothetical protein n=1 Tax=Streptomyces collinus TaxID=42684 RepID=UPI0005BCC098|nr:hypothetical protein [Streptomyces collinus]
MDHDKPPAPPRRPEARQPEGCLTVAIRLPVRIVVLVLVLPVRMAWDALVVCGRFLRDTVLRPVGRALLWAGWALLVWPWVTLWRHVLVPVGTALGVLGHVLLVVPLRWFHARVLTPMGHALARVARAAGAGLAWLYARVLAPVGRAVVRALEGVGRLLAAAGAGVWAGAAWLALHLVVAPARVLHAWVLAPAGRALARLAAAVVTGAGAVLYWTARVLLVLPALALWRWVLVPTGRVLAVVAREVAEALGHAWRVAGRISRAAGRVLATLFRWIFVEPSRWVYRTVLTPVGHVVRDLVLRPAARAARAVGRTARQALDGARDTLRQARADFRRLLVGEPRPRKAVDRREPTGRGTRTLGSSTTALTKD